MKVTIRITTTFKKEAKPLLKKYNSLSKDLEKLEEQLLVNPYTGTSLGKSLYKIRLKISSKLKGKSGGARVISFVETQIIGIAEQISKEEILVNLISIYDKAEVSTISDKELRELVKNLQQ